MAKKHKQIKYLYNLDFGLESPEYYAILSETPSHYKVSIKQFSNAGDIDSADKTLIKIQSDKNFEIEIKGIDLKKKMDLNNANLLRVALSLLNKWDKTCFSQYKTKRVG
jgi:hypothetical protein